MACYFIVHSHLLIYHHLLGHREMSISHILYQYSFEYDFLHCWVFVISYQAIWLRVLAQSLISYYGHILWINLGYHFILIWFMLSKWEIVGIILCTCINQIVFNFGFELIRCQKLIKANCLRPNYYNYCCCWAYWAYALLIGGYCYFFMYV